MKRIFSSAEEAESELPFALKKKLKMIGMPTLVANYISPYKTVILQSESGLLGIRPYPTKEEVYPDLINARKEIITTIPDKVIWPVG